MDRLTLAECKSRGFAIQRVSQDVRSAGFKVIHDGVIRQQTPTAFHGESYPTREAATRAITKWVEQHEVPEDDLIAQAGRQIGIGPFRPSGSEDETYKSTNHLAQSEAAGEMRTSQEEE